MEPGKRYTQTVERAFHISMACLEPSTADSDNVSVLLVFGSSEFILCSLNKHKAIQTQLDLNFQSGDKIAFMSSGKGRVHLTGKCCIQRMRTWTMQLLSSLRPVYKM